MNEFDFEDEGVESLGEYDINDISNASDKKKGIAYGLYCILRSSQYHYNGVKVRYKLLSSTWIVGAFIGFGYLFTGQEVGLPLDNLLATFMLGIFASIGLILIYFLDVAIYHKPLESAFFSLLELEKKHSFLHKVNQNAFFLLNKGTVGPLILDGMFYSFFVFIMLSISSISLYAYCSSISFSYAGLVLGFSILVTFSLSSLLLFAARESSIGREFRESLRKRLS